jgi:hypothetical protein
MSSIKHFSSSWSPSLNARWLLDAMDDYQAKRSK